MIVIRSGIDDEMWVLPKFQGKELKCKCGKCKVSIISQELAEDLTEFRSIWGKPFTPNSCHRCNEHNRSIPNAVDYSDHISGFAVDKPLPSKDKEDFIELAKEIYEYVYVGNSYVHCSSRKR